MSCERRGVVGYADHQSASIFVDIVYAVRDGDADGIRTEVVIIDAPRDTFPTPARILEVAHQFAFLAIDADNGQMTATEAVAQMSEIFELTVAVGTDTGGNLLVIDAEGIAHLMEQTRHCVRRDRNAECCQFLGDGRGGTA